MCVRDRLKAYLKHKKISQGAFAESMRVICMENVIFA